MNLLKVALLVAESSHCTKLKVGAVASVEGRIIATGYNGSISGFSNTCEEEQHYCEHCDSIVQDTGIFKVPIRRENSNTKRQYSVHHRVCETVVNKVSKTKDFIVHAEQNLIAFCAKQGIALKGATITITHSPCKECAKLIVQSGIAKVHFSEEYRDLRSLEFLKEAGIEVTKVHNV